MLPAYLALAGVAAASAAPAVGPKARRVALAAWVAIVPLAWSAWLTVEEYRRVWSELPVEVLPASRALRRLAAPGARVIARKPHLAYHAGVESAPFPPAYDLDDLARSVARLRADFLFFSNAEAKARPQFWFLLDTVMAVPGLRPVFFQARPPAALYRIGPELGMPLAWATDDTLRARLLGRARALDPVRSECSARLNLAAEALARRDAEVALRHLEIATGTCPDLPLAWTMAGDAWMGLQRPDSARASYQRALALDPAEARAKVGLGWSLLAAGELPLAARTWRDVVDRTDDPTTLETMARLFERIGDVEAARRARAARARPR
jgi:tetratricopeptide (TPR) repeat protein